MFLTTADPAPHGDRDTAPPPSDAVLRQFLINWIASLEAHGNPRDGRTLRRGDLAAVDLGRPAFGGNVATLLTPLSAAPAGAVMAALDDFYGFAQGDKAGTVFLFSPWPTPDLSRHGWTLMGEEPLMLRPAGGTPPSPPPGLRIEEVRDEAGLRAFELAIVRGFGSSELEAQGPGAVLGPGVLDDDHYRLWVGWEDDRPVSAAASFTAAGVTNVTLVGTDPAARRRGYGAALTWRATLAAPALPALLLATDEGRPVYERMGYRALRNFTLWSRDRKS